MSNGVARVFPSAAQFERAVDRGRTPGEKSPGFFYIRRCLW